MSSRHHQDIVSICMRFDLILNQVIYEGEGESKAHCDRDFDIACGSAQIFLIQYLFVSYIAFFVENGGNRALGHPWLTL